MIIYNNNNNHHQKHKTVGHINQNGSAKRAARVKTSATKRKINKKGKSLSKVNTRFLKALGLMVRKRQKI